MSPRRTSCVSSSASSPSVGWESSRTSRLLEDYIADSSTGRDHGQHVLLDGYVNVQHDWPRVVQHLVQRRVKVGFSTHAGPAATISFGNRHKIWIPLRHVWPPALAGGFRMVDRSHIGVCPIAGHEP